MPQSSVKAKVSEHESGCQKILFSTFNCSTISEDEFSKVINQARQNLGQMPITQIQLKADQIEERKLLEKMGFSCDGIEFQLSVIKLREILQAKNHRLPPDFHLREFSVTKDMESLIQLEKDIHAADTTSRVNFNTDVAVESMKNYYRRAASNNGVFVLMEGLRLIGVVGFMNDGKNESCTQISSVGLALNVQGKGLFFPFLLAAFEISPFKDRYFLNGVTTTRRVIAAAEKYGAKTLGYSLYKRS